MGSRSKGRMTAEKRAREQRLRERRAAKEERKAMRKDEAARAEAPDDNDAAGGDGEPT